jgi:hypothetical protein
MTEEMYLSIQQLLKDILKRAVQVVEALAAVTLEVQADTSKKIYI